MTARRALADEGGPSFALGQYIATSRILMDVVAGQGHRRRSIGWIRREE